MIHDLMALVPSDKREKHYLIKRGNDILRLSYSTYEWMEEMTVSLEREGLEPIQVKRALSNTDKGMQRLDIFNYNEPPYKGLIHAFGEYHPQGVLRHVEFYIQERLAADQDLAQEQMDLAWRIQHHPEEFDASMTEERPEPPLIDNWEYFITGKGPELVYHYADEHKGITFLRVHADITTEPYLGVGFEFNHPQKNHLVTAYHMPLMIPPLDNTLERLLQKYS